MTNVRLVVLAVLSALLVAGCGSSSGGGGSADDPAALIPAGAPLYAEATVDPQGQVRTDAEAALRKILRTDDPGAAITKALENASRKGGDLSFKDDVEPWLGDKVGAAVTALHGKEHADYVIVIASTDDGKADDALAKQQGDVVKRSYKGIDYRFDRKDSTAAAVVDHRVVIGTEAGLRSAIDASNGDSLADANNLQAIRGKVAQDRLGLVYVDVQGLFQAIASSGDPQVGAALQAFAGAAPRAIGAALQAQGDVVRVDAVSIGTPQSASTGKSGADMLAALPSDSWLGLGVANLGQTLDRVVQTVASAGGLTGVGVKAVLGQFQQKTGLDLRTDVLSWMGDAGVFVGGTSKHDLRGALVIKSTDPAKTKRAIAALQRLARSGSGARVSTLRFQGVDDGFTIRSGSGPRVDVGLAGDKFVVSVGSFRAFKDAIAPSTAGLGTTRAFTDAASKLGNGLRPSFFLDVPQLVQVIDAFAGNDAKLQMAKPYLQTFGAVVGGGGKDEGDGVTRYRFAVTLR
jgi:Protein of unknown function (DUF3352)